VLTEEKNINGKIYCVSTMREGAAGTTYIMYTYKTNSWYGIKLTTFSLGFSNCGNYSEPQNSECKNVRSNFDIDSIISSLDWK